MNPHRQHHTPPPAFNAVRERIRGAALAVAIGLTVATLLTRWH